MPKSAVTIARKLLEGEAGLEELRVHEFDEDASPDDGELIERLYKEFSSDFDRARAQLTKQYGTPIREGKEDDAAVLLNGVFRFAVWEVDGTELFLAAAHEDRDVPILLMMGTDSGNLA
jgi:hypothetical protein